LELPPTVFRIQWPMEISNNLVSFNNPTGKINNSDLEMAGLLFLWLCMEAITPDLAQKHIALFSNNLPTVSWVNKIASQKSQIAAQLVCVLALRLKIQQTCPLTPVHIPGVDNALTDIPSGSFSSIKEWECKTNDNLLTLFNQKFPFPHQASWMVFHFDTKMTTRGFPHFRWRVLCWPSGSNYPELEDTLGKLDKICPTSGVGPFPTRGAIHDKSACPHGVRCKSPQRTLWKGEVHHDWNSRWRSYGHWTGDHAGLWGKPHKSNWERQTPPTAITNI
jgi:hypothetical protein